MDPSTYIVREIFHTIQGEGFRAGEPSAWLRLAGCNLWNGRPDGRHSGRGGCAEWCDTDFAHGDKMTMGQILEQLDAVTPQRQYRWVVISGGEPTLQLDRPLVDALHAAGWKIAIETNGTMNPEHGVLLDALDWVTVSPKVGGHLRRTEGHELKVVLPGADGLLDWTDEQVAAMGRDGQWGMRYVQPRDPVEPSSVGGISFLHGNRPDAAETFRRNVQRCVEFVMAHPGWRLSMQAHKIAGLR